MDGQGKAADSNFTGVMWNAWPPHKRLNEYNNGVYVINVLLKQCVLLSSLYFGEREPWRLIFRIFIWK